MLSDLAYFFGIFLRQHVAAKKTDCAFDGTLRDSILVFTPKIWTIHNKENESVDFILVVFTHKIWAIHKSCSDKDDTKKFRLNESDGIKKKPRLCRNRIGKVEAYDWCLKVVRCRGRV